MFDYMSNGREMYYNISEIYDEKLLSIISPIMHITSLITIIFTVILIFIIIKKTPKQMKNFQAYLLSYILYALLLETVMLIYKPVLLHPYLAMISDDSLIKHNQQSSIIMIALMMHSAFSLVNCTAGMSAERYYAVRNLGHSKKPKIVFFILFISNLMIFAICAVFVNTDLLLMSYQDKSKYLISHIQGSEEVLNFSSILLPRIDNRAILIIVFFGLCAYTCVLYVTTLGFMLLNAKTPTSLLKTETKNSKNLQKNNKMLLRCTYFQFAGYCLLAGVPLTILVLSYLFIPEPSNSSTYCILVMNFFGLYDTFVTIICIKPYRMFFVNLFPKMYVKESSYGIPMVHLH